MAGVKALILLALFASIGLLFLVLGCALPLYNCWWPLFVLVFYVLAPMPILIAKRYQDDMASSSACTEMAFFGTTGIVVSAFALPVILAHAGEVIAWGACALTLCANIVCFLTILGYFVVFSERNNEFGGYSLW